MCTYHLYMYMLESSARFTRASGPGVPWALGPRLGPGGALRGPWALVGPYGDRALRGPWALVAPSPVLSPGPCGGFCGDRALPGALQILKEIMFNVR